MLSRTIALFHTGRGVDENKVHSSGACHGNGSPDVRQCHRGQSGAGVRWQSCRDTSSLVAVGQLVYPSAVAGTKGDALAQVDEIVQGLREPARSNAGLGIGSMIQHTIFLKNGAANPIQILTRFHEDARRLAPSLKDKPSVGIIIRVPGFADPNTLVLIDSVAAAPAAKGGPDDFKRVLFKFGPQEIAQSLTSAISCSAPAWKPWTSSMASCRAVSTRRSKRSSANTSTC